MESGPSPQQSSSARRRRKKLNRRLMLGGAIGLGAIAVGSGIYRRVTSSTEAQRVTVGGLAVTCNLTLPVACAAAAVNEAREQTAGTLTFGYRKYTGWPEVKESLMSGSLQAA